MNNLYRKSGAAEFGISLEQFTQIVQHPGNSDHPGELVLTRACAAGNEAAWERFVALYREKLYAFALSMTRDAVAARELADSLYADLYGTRQLADGRRVSRLESYSGRGSLESWLRAVVTQEYVNRYRSGRNNVSYDAGVESGIQFAAPAAAGESSVHDSRLERAFNAALSGLGAEDRFLLTSYFFDGRTLASIAAVLGVHESTASRRIDKITRNLRRSTIRELGKSGIDRREAMELLSIAAENLDLDVRGLMGAPSSARKP